MTRHERHTHTALRSEDAGATWIDFSAYVEGFATHDSTTADRGTATINCFVYPAGLAVEQLIVLTIDSETVFNGRVARPALHYVGNSVVIECETVMANLSYKWGGEGTDPEMDELGSRIYADGALVSDIITNYCEALAVPVSLHDIAVSTWSPCLIFPVTLRVGQQPISQIREWDDLEGCWTASTRNGAITRRPIAIGTADFTATEGDTIISADRTPQGTESITNRWIIDGFEYEGGKFGGVGVGDFQLDNDNIPDPPKSHTMQKRSNYVQDDADALTFATRGVGRTNFPYDETNLVLLGDPTITIGQTVQIDSPSLDHAGDSTSLRFVVDVAQRYGAGVGFETSVKCIRVA